MSNDLVEVLFGPSAFPQRGWPLIEIELQKFLNGRKVFSAQIRIRTQLAPVVQTMTPLALAVLLQRHVRYSTANSHAECARAPVHVQIPLFLNKSLPLLEGIY